MTSTNCSRENVYVQHPLDRFRSLYLPGLHAMRSEHVSLYGCDPFIPRIEDWDMTVDKDLGRLVLTAWWTGQQRHSAYMTLAELQAEDAHRIFRDRVLEVFPRPVFEDEAVVAYNDPLIERWRQ